VERITLGSKSDSRDHLPTELPQDLHEQARRVVVLSRDLLDETRRPEDLDDLVLDVGVRLARSPRHVCRVPPG
jgi:hypothetical protein